MVYQRGTYNTKVGAYLEGNLDHRDGGAGHAGGGGRDGKQRAREDRGGKGERCDAR